VGFMFAWGLEVDLPDRGGWPGKSTSFLDFYMRREPDNRAEERFRDGGHEFSGFGDVEEVDVGWVAVLVAECVGVDGLEEREVCVWVDGAVGQACAAEYVCHNSGGGGGGCL
jgi:hypothetical protein